MAEDGASAHDRNLLRGAAAFVVGAGIISLAVVNQFRAEMGALDRLIELETAASDEPIGSFAEGLFGSVLWWELIILAVLAATFLAAYFTRNAHPAIVLALGAFVALGLVGSAVAAHMGDVPEHLMSAYRDVPSAFQVWLTAAGAVAIPGAMGVITGTMLGRRRREQVLREAGYRASMRSRFAQEAEDAAEEAACDGDVALGRRAPAVYRGERRSLTCGACGARNAPINARCVRCGAALSPAE